MVNQSLAIPSPQNPFRFSEEFFIILGVAFLPLVYGRGPIFIELYLVKLKG